MAGTSPAMTDSAEKKVDGRDKPGLVPGNRCARVRASSGRLRRGGVLRQQVDQGALDRGLSGRRTDLGPQQIGDVEHVARAFAESRDMRRCDVEVELRNRGG